MIKVLSHVFYVPNPTQPQGHGTYSPYNEIFRNIPVLISFDDLLRHRFLRIESKSDLRQRHRRKSDPYDRRPQIHQCHFPLHDQNQTRFRRNGRQSRIACLYNGNGYHQQKFQRSIGHQSAGHTRMGNRRCDRSHDQTGIQILSD